MSLTRRYSAVGLAAFVLLLGACGGESAPTTPTPDAGELNDNIRHMALSSNLLTYFSEGDEVPPEQWLHVSGLTAIGSYVLFRNTVFSPSTTPWLRMDLTPHFLREELAWRFRFWVDPAAFAALDNGIYSASMDVIVPAALNSPQTLNALLCKGAPCLVIGSNVVNTLAGTEPTWARGLNVNAMPGNYYFDDYFLVIPPFTTAHITMEGSSCAAGQTLGDPYIYAFQLNGDYIGSNDDGLCGLNSYLPVFNNSPMSWTVRVRATTFGSFGTGSYRLRANSGSPFLMAEPVISPEDQEVLRNKANGTATP